MSTSFYSREELQSLGLQKIGSDVLVSRKTSMYKPESISIGDHVRIDDFTVLSGGAGILLGNYIHIGCYCALYGGSCITIGDFSGLAARVTIYSESDDYSGLSMVIPMAPPQLKPRYHKGHVILKRHTIVGVGTTILPGVTINEGVAVGAHSLINKDCIPWSIYSGHPQKKIGWRSKKILDLETQFVEVSAENRVP